MGARTPQVTLSPGQGASHGRDQQRAFEGEVVMEIWPTEHRQCSNHVLLDDFQGLYCPRYWGLVQSVMGKPVSQPVQRDRSFEVLNTAHVDFNIF